MTNIIFPLHHDGQDGKDALSVGPSTRNAISVCIVVFFIWRQPCVLWFVHRRS